MTTWSSAIVEVIVDEWAVIEGRLDPVAITLHANGTPLTATAIRAAQFGEQIKEQRRAYIDAQETAAKMFGADLDESTRHRNWAGLFAVDELDRAVERHPTNGAPK